MYWENFSIYIKTELYTYLHLLLKNTFTGTEKAYFIFFFVWI